MSPATFPEKDFAGGWAMGLVYDHAAAYLAAGLSVIPIHPNGSKAPAVKWKKYQAEMATEDDLKKWFPTDDGNGIAIVCGAISGGLEVIDFDAIEVFEAWKVLFEQRSPGLLERLPQVRTPRGVHVYYRLAAVVGNLKLAQEPSTDPDTGKPAPKTLIETRGEGGYVLAPGCPAACHPTGGLYVHAGGPPLTQIPNVEKELT